MPNEGECGCAGNPEPAKHGSYGPIIMVPEDAFSDIPMPDFGTLPGVGGMPRRPDPNKQFNSQPANGQSVTLARLGLPVPGTRK